MTGPQRQIARPSRPTRAGLLALAVLTIVTLAFTARADGFVYCPWGPQQTFGFGPSGVGRANLDGTGVDQIDCFADRSRWQPLPGSRGARPACVADVVRGSPCVWPS